MIYKRQEKVMFGEIPTIQTFFTCDSCFGETNCVEWSLKISKNGVTHYICPTCSVHHIFVEGENK